MQFGSLFWYKMHAIFQNTDRWLVDSENKKQLVPKQRQSEQIAPLGWCISHTKEDILNLLAMCNEVVVYETSLSD